MELSEGSIVLKATDKADATVSEASFQLDSALLSVLRPGDLVQLKRTLSLGVGVSVIRQGRPLFAVGAVTGMQLGGIVLRNGCSTRGNTAPSQNTWVEVRCGGEIQILHSGQECSMGDYGIWVEETWQECMPVVDERVALFLDEQNLRDPSVRSARRLARSFEVVQHPETEELFRQLDALEDPGG